jgi:hypothetical protein
MFLMALGVKRLAGGFVSIRESESRRVKRLKEN